MTKIKVNIIKQQIQSGNYPLDSRKIAESFLSLENLLINSLDLSAKIIELNDLTKNICNILDKEFEFLKSQNIDDFLSIQDQKEKLLADLSQKNN